MGTTAAYDQIADWYEQEFLGRPPVEPDDPASEPLGIYATLDEMLGRGTDVCVEIGCGTGVYALTGPIPRL